MDEACQAKITDLLKKLESSPNDRSISSSNLSQYSVNAAVSEIPYQEITRDPQLDETLKEELNRGSATSNIQRFRQTLPAYKAKQEVLKLIMDNQVGIYLFNDLILSSTLIT